MIKVNELRIGSIIDTINGMAKVEVIYPNRVDVRTANSGLTRMFDWEGIEPIPLTPEVLLKCGFKRYKTAGRWEYLILTHHLDADSSVGISYNTENGQSNINLIIENRTWASRFPLQIRSLHQLQNVFFSLIGSELQYNP